MEPPLSIGCMVVENKVTNSMYHRLELDWLIYNFIGL